MLVFGGDAVDGWFEKFEYGIGCKGDSSQTHRTNLEFSPQTSKHGTGSPSSSEKA